MKKSLISNLLFHILIIILIAGLMVTVMTLAHPLGFNNYGYDYGFYSYAVEHTPLNSPAYFAGQVNDYGNHLFVILNWLRLPQIPTLDFLFMFFFVGSGIILSQILKKFGWLATIAGIILFAFSIAQNQLFTMFLWKAAYGQMLLLILFWLIQLRLKYFWELLPLGILLITHKTTSLITLISLVPHYIFSSRKNKVLIFGAMVAAGLIFLFGLNGFSYLKQLQDSSIKNGLFLSTLDYLKYSWFLIPLASYGIYRSTKTKTNLTWLGLLGLSLLIIFFQLAFYQRVILFADLALIFFGAVTIYELHSKPLAQKLLFVLLIIASASSWFLFTKTIQPQITEPEITEIHNFTDHHQGAFVLVLSAQDGPWLLANLSGNNRLAAPGLFEDNYSKAVWQTFWLNPKNQDFLNIYPKPLFLYERSTIFYLEPWECLSKISSHFFEYKCAD